MSKSPINHKLKAIVTTLKPWALGLIFVLILRETGVLSGISFYAQTAVMETGLMDADADTDNARPTAFDYNFQLKDLQGNVVDANAFKGKVIFLNLWATWCGPCRVEMPSIQELYNSVDKEKIAFIMLSLDNPNQQHKIVKYIEDKKFDFPVYVLSGGVTEQLNVPSIPTTFVISKDGLIKSKKIGAANYNTERVKKMLETLAAEEFKD
jgi:thiol-disulfide isomerase/thioredoxin